MTDRNNPGPAAHLDLTEKVAGDGALHLNVGGELDMDSAGWLSETITAVLPPAGAEFVLDLGSLTFLDASGVTVLVEAYQQAHRCGVPFRVVNASGTVLAVLQLVGLYSILNGR